MRLVTGATARSIRANLYEETCWQPITERCDNAMLIMMYKIKNNLTAEYLGEVLPPDNNELTHYNLRNSQNIAVPVARLETFRKSFIPFAINLWNNLSLHVRQVESLEEFKMALKKMKKEPNILYYYGKRWPSVHHSRIRIGCSKLNHDLCYNLHVIGEPNCSCGEEIEDAYHYFLDCPKYTDFRTDLFNAISVYEQVNMETVLQGNVNLTEIQNMAIFEAVHLYIERTKRF